MSNRPGPAQWAMIDRLVAAGCPVGFRQLLRLIYPLRVSDKTPGMGTNIFPLLSGATGIVFQLRIEALLSTNIVGFSVRKSDWTKLPMTWTEPCAEHVGFYCFHGPDGRPRTPRDDTLNFQILSGGGGFLERGTVVEGFLLGATPLRLVPAAHGTIDAILVVKTALEDEYPFPVSLSTAPFDSRAIVGSDLVGNAPKKEPSKAGSKE